MNKDKNKKDFHNIMVPKGTLQRLPKYYEYLKAQKKEGEESISSTKIADEMHLNSVLVRKDLALVSSVAGKPRVGFCVAELMDDIEIFLGYDNVSDAILIGAGSLGRALLSYEGFKDYGLNIAAAFDIDPKLVNKRINGIMVFHINKLENLVKRLNIHMGIISTPKYVAQEVADLMIKAGIKGIWNFAPVHLTVPKEILLKDENLAVSLALVSKRLDNVLIMDEDTTQK
ncbi:MAG: redox-sensing transcriptional repressor Rex [Bacteroidales bacterium]|jgi:redox-sensing transcriptional repressor